MPPLTPVVKNLLILNVGVFALVFLAQEFGFDQWGLQDLLALHYPTSERFYPVQLVTHFFMHGSLTHIFFNMFGLVMFGPLLEHRYGPQRFLLLYLFAALTAVLLHFGYTTYELNRYAGLITEFRANPSPEHFTEFFGSIDLDGLVMDNGERVSAIVGDLTNKLATGADPATVYEASSLMGEFVGWIRDIPMVGASGALYGVVAAFAILYPDFKLMLIFLPIPVRARYFVPFLLAVDLFLGVMNFGWDPIAHFAHLGGALGGGLLAWYWRRGDPPVGTRRWN